jgi:uncharacterized membrane protein
VAVDCECRRRTVFVVRQEPSQRQRLKVGTSVIEVLPRFAEDSAEVVPLGYQFAVAPVLAALIAVVVLFVQFWKLTLVALLVALAAFLLYQRFREFTGW